MKNFSQNFKKYRWVLVLALLLIPQVFVFAQLGGSGGGGDLGGSGSGGDLAGGGKLQNPIKANNLGELIAVVLKIINLIGVPVVTLFLIWSGFLFVKARGNAKELETAKDTLMYTIIGAAILLGSYVLAEAISGTVQELQR